MSDEQGELYPERQPWELEPHYSQHVGAMTSEGLHAKSDIAIQLAWRDAELARLQSALTTAESQLQAQRERAERAEAELGAATRSMLLATARQVAAEKRLAELQGELDKVRALVDQLWNAGDEVDALYAGKIRAVLGDPAPGAHVWTAHERDGWTVCSRCGLVRNYDREPTECRDTGRADAGKP